MLVSNPGLLGQPGGGWLCAARPVTRTIRATLCFAKDATVLELSCPGCGAANSYDANFCKKCGAQ
jgi:hypothetical protein